MSTDLVIFDMESLDDASDELFDRLLTGGQGVVVLIDTSGSMEYAAGNPAPGQPLKSRYDAMCEAVKPYRGQANVCIIAFSSSVTEIREGARIPPPCGGTDLHLAIRLAATKKPARTVLISDGEPESQAAALHEARSLPGVLETIFVGDHNDRAAKTFMTEIATKCGGSFQDLSGTSGDTLAPALARLMLPP
jgi:Mg-chelatase subunit ChlD